MKTPMVAIGCSLFRRFCNRVRASWNERRPIFAQAQRMSSRVTGRQRSAHQLHSFAACADAWRLLRSFLPPRSPWQRAGFYSKLPFFLTVSLPCNTHLKQLQERDGAIDGARQQLRMLL